MSLMYDQYIDQHRNNVMLGYKWMLDSIGAEEIARILPSLENDPNMILANEFAFSLHDQSKFRPDEYDAYDNYFYNGGYSTKEGKAAFERAFMHHKNRNPHHWQYWILIDDDGIPNPRALEMDDVYILEMICDWWSFSWRKFLDNGAKDIKDLYEIYNWYDDHKKTMILGEETKEKVEKLLDMIKSRLEFQDAEYIKRMYGSGNE